MPPRKEHVNFADLDAQFREVFSPKDGFSPEAVAHYRSFVREGKFQVDNREVSADAFFWLDPLYDIKRTDIFGIRHSDGSWLQRPLYPHGIMMRKASQMGATVFSILFLVWLCIDPTRGLNVGCFWPTEDDVIDFVQMRFMPLIESSEKLRKMLRNTRVDNTRTKQIGRGNLFFRYVRGKSQTDSVPMDVIVGDEVRLWGEPNFVAGVMQRLDERFGQSEVRLKVWMSTVGSPGDAMETGWDQSTQVKYVTTCPAGCVTEVRERPEDEADRVVMHDELHSLRPGALVLQGIVMSDHHPHKIVKLTGQRQAVWCCPVCQATIDDTAVGPGFVATFPDAPGMYGLEFARTLSRAITPYELLRQHDTAADKKQFWNGWMAKPYRDPKGTIVKDDHIRAARSDSRVQWYLNAPPGIRTFLGADFRTEEIHVVVLGQQGEGESAQGQVVHLEVIQGKGDDGKDPFERLESLLFQYSVEAAIIDYRPYTTTTLAMAQRNNTRLYLASYVPGEMIRMKVKAGASTRMMDEDVRESNIVLLDQTKSLKYSLNSFAMGNWKIPAEGLDQFGFYDRKRTLHPVYDVSLEFTDHLQHIALAHIPKVTKNASNEAVGASAQFEEKFVDVGYDPHFTHAFNYAVMASYLQPSGMQLIHAAPSAQTITNPLGMRLPKPAQVAERRCGRCRHWEGDEQRGDTLAYCPVQNYTTEAVMPPCHARFYRPKP